MAVTIRPSSWPRRWLLWIALGLLLRLLFVYFPRTIDDDTWDYLELGRNLIQHGVYGLGPANDISPCLFRLPGYPIVLGIVSSIFAPPPSGSWMVALYLFQIAVDICSGLLVAAFARRWVGPRAAEVALALAMLCPFTSAESATAMTECLSVFAVALGIYAAGRALSAELAGKRDLPALLLAASAGALAPLLRPDGIILTVALAAGLFLYILRDGPGNWRPALRRALTSTAIFSLAALLPLAIWTVRNWRTFHVFQPLAPRILSDPGERVDVGLHRWYRTWTAEYLSTYNVYWQVDTGHVDPANLPPRTFDSPDQRARTLALFDELNRTATFTASLDERFGALADERIKANPIRYYLWLPALRAADMLLRPRTEEFRLNIEWWNWRSHPRDSAFALLIGLINLAYVLAALWGFLRARVPWPWMLGGYILLRLVLLGTMENPEPRYTIQCFPILILAAAAAFATPKTGSDAVQSHPTAPLPRPAVRKSSSD
jgi:hypothetical protein